MIVQPADIRILYPKKIDWDAFFAKKATTPFDIFCTEMLEALSSSLLKDPQARQYPDVITFAFFCRKANIKKIQEQYEREEHRIGRGCLFHIAPSNVPINFAFSLVAGLLSGNNNIVRVSSKNFPQVEIIARHIQDLSSSHASTSRIVLVQYDRDNREATDFFSSHSDVRVIWGGDATITSIRRSPIPSRSFDVTFADRYSFATINADAVSEDAVGKLVEGFYNDTYLFDQNACSAPHLIVWTGDRKRIEQVRERFWNSLHELVAKKYEFQSVMAVDKLTAMYRQAAAMEIREERTKDNFIKRVMLSSLNDKIDEYRCACGYFSEYISEEDLNEVVPIVNNKYQTMSYYGYEEDRLKSFVQENKMKGIDRIVPIGHTTDFSLIWDGYDLIRTLSRKIQIL